MDAKTIRYINLAVTGVGIPIGDAKGLTPSGEERESSDEADPQIPYDQALAISTQSLAQSAAIAVSDAADMLRNIETIMTTAMGTAMAKWLEEPGNVLYSEIVTAANSAITNAANNYKTIGTNAQSVLEKFKPSS